MQDSMGKCRQYLEQSETPWIQYLLLDEGQKTNSEGEERKAQILANPLVQTLVDQCLQWPQPSLQRHNDAKHPFHQMHILLDMGLTREDAVIAQVASKIMENQAEEGPFLSLTLIPERYGGTGKESFSWILCDAPLLLHFLIRAGYQNEPEVLAAIEHLASIVDDNGWRCKGSMPKFHGPGSRKDFCPFANLISLKVFSQLPEFHDEAFVQNAINSFFWHWQNTEERKVYLFAMGTHFRRLKYPLVWYDILDVGHTLSYFRYAREHAVFQEMVELIVDKQQESGGFIPESIFMNFKGWSFGQKKVESPMLSWKIYELLRNVA